MDLDNLKFKHFLKYVCWEEACELLELQIKSKSPHFNTFNNIYFKKLGTSIDVVKSRLYFSEKIESNLFYCLSKEFYTKKYSYPKKNIGLRRYIFFNYPMAVLYYAVGLYMLRVVHKFLIENKNDRIKSYYGGNLTIKKNKLLISPRDIFYRRQYNSFKKDLRKEATDDGKNKLVIKLDVQNFFENISVTKLLSLMSKNVSPTKIQGFNFDQSAKDLIIFFFKFINDGNDSLPQGDNNIISQFIAYIYLFFADLDIEDAIKDKKLGLQRYVRDYKIIRYVDDIYISFDFHDKTEKTIPSKIGDLLNEIAENYYTKFGLRFNEKIDIFNMDNGPDKERFLKVMKKVSGGLMEPLEDNSKSLKKTERILELIRTIKFYSLSDIYKNATDGSIDDLKNIFDENVACMLKERTSDLDKLFENFDFGLFSLSPREFIAILMKSGQSKKFETFLLDKKSLTTFDRDLIIQYLCQNDFKPNILVEKLLIDNQIKDIISKCFTSIDSKIILSDGYFNVNFDKLKLFSTTSLIEQIRLRIYNEKILQYSVALNHLVNEIQLICCGLD